MPHPCAGGGVDEGAVLVAPVERLGGRHHEQCVDSFERVRGVGAVRRDAHLRAGDVRGARGVTHEQDRGEVAELRSDAAAELAGGTGEGKGHAGATRDRPRGFPPAHAPGPVSGPV